MKGTVLWLLCLELVMQELPGVCICRYRLDIACPGLARSAKKGVDDFLQEDASDE